jgi:hypothetical protein
MLKNLMFVPNPAGRMAAMLSEFHANGRKMESARQPKAA